MKTIFSSDFNEVMIVKNLLENASIEVYLINQTMSSIEPWVISSAGYKPVLLKVSDEKFDNALKIIDGYKSGQYIIE